MQGAIEVVVLSAVAPTTVALVVATLWRKLVPAAWSEHSALPLGVALGFFAGYWLLPDWAPLWPTRHWQWLPYLVLPTAIAGGLPERAGRLVRWFALAVLALAAAWLLVPKWPDLYPPRLVSVGLVTAYLMVLSAALDALPDRAAGRWFAGSLVAVAAVLTVVLLTLGTSALFARVSLVAAAALAGSFVATYFAGLNSAQATRGAAPVYVILTGGLAYVGAIEPSQPLPWMLLVPAVPLAWWLMAVSKQRAVPPAEDTKTGRSTDIQFVEH